MKTNFYRKLIVMVMAVCIGGPLLAGDIIRYKCRVVSSEDGTWGLKFGSNDLAHCIVTPFSSSVKTDTEVSFEVMVTAPGTYTVEIHAARWDGQFEYSAAIIIKVQELEVGGMSIESAPPPGSVILINAGRARTSLLFLSEENTCNLPMQNLLAVLRKEDM